MLRASTTPSPPKHAAFLLADHEGLCQEGAPHASLGSTLGCAVRSLLVFLVGTGREQCVALSRLEAPVWDRVGKSEVISSSQLSVELKLQGA